MLQVFCLHRSLVSSALALRWLRKLAWLLVVAIRFRRLLPLCFDGRFQSSRAWQNDSFAANKSSYVSFGSSCVDTRLKLPFRACQQNWENLNSPCSTFCTTWTQRFLNPVSPWKSSHQQGFTCYDADRRHYHVGQVVSGVELSPGPTRCRVRPCTVQ